MKLHLLENRKICGYTTFGTYWTKGEARLNTFTLTTADGCLLPMQTEIAARWPDGSIKWARHTADARLMGSTVEVLQGNGAPTDPSICIEEKDDGWYIDGGSLRF